MKKLLGIYITLQLIIFSSSNALAEPKYLGVATCSSSNCHGSVTPKQNSNIMHNEYVTWFKFSAHSQAYKALGNDDSKKIAAHLGIDDPQKSDLCLNCHATNVDKSLRGNKFRLSDGVSCESCHGAAENYIKSHTSRSSSHKDNVAKGLKDLTSTTERSKLCLSCHIGTENKNVNHRLIGAGHPRLTFELDTFGILQPNHWQADKDYIERKEAYTPAKAWLSGQATRSVQMLNFIASKEHRNYGLMPELTLFNCYSCHRTLEKDFWKKQDYAGKPGELQLNLSSPKILAIGLEEIDPKIAQEVTATVESSQSDLYHGDLSSSATRLRKLIETEAIPRIENHAYNNTYARKTLSRVAKFAASSNHHSFEIAEQSVMAISALLAQLNAEDSYTKSQLDNLYNSLNQEENFNPITFQSASSSFLKFIEKRFDE